MYIIEIVDHQFNASESRIWDTAYTNAGDAEEQAMVLAQSYPDEYTIDRAPFERGSTIELINDEHETCYEINVWHISTIK